MLKIVKDNVVIDVVRVPRYVKFLSSGHIAITDKVSAQGIVGSDSTTIYSFIPGVTKATGIVTVSEITEEEFAILSRLLGDDHTVYAAELALAEAKRVTLTKLSNVCKSTIIAGFSIKLSDGNIQHFRLTVEDQLNLVMLENQLNGGGETFIYHATNQPCKVYLKTDVQKIISAFRAFTLYHTTYFNAVKQYINSLTDIEKISSFTYGTDISDTVENRVIRKILKKGVAFNEGQG